MTDLEWLLSREVRRWAFSEPQNKSRLMEPLKATGFPEVLPPTLGARNGRAWKAPLSV